MPLVLGPLIGAAAGLLGQAPLLPLREKRPGDPDDWELSKPLFSWRWVVIGLVVLVLLGFIVVLLTTPWLPIT